MWEGFGVLSSERSSAMGGMCPIPFRAILAYADYAEMILDEREMFVSQVLTLDAMLVSARNRQAAKSSK